MSTVIEAEKLTPPLNTLHFEVGVDGLFFSRNVFKADEIVFSEVFHTVSYSKDEGKSYSVGRFLSSNNCDELSRLL